MPTGRPDWFGTIVSAGKHDSKYIPIAVTKDGVILAVMRGEYDELPVPIAVDEDGVMQAILTIGVVGVEDSSQVINAGAEITAFTITGKGSVYGGNIRTTEGPAQSGTIGKVKILLDGVDLGWQGATEMIAFGETGGQGFPLTLLCKQALGTGGTVRWALMRELRFKDSFVLKIKNNMSISRTYAWTMLKAII